MSYPSERIEKVPSLVPNYIPPGLQVNGKFLARISSRSALFTDFDLLMGRIDDFSAQSIRLKVCFENVLGRKSETARRKIYQELKGRYILDAENPLFQIFLQEWKQSATPQDRQLTAYLLFALNDRLVFAVGCEWLFEHLVTAPSTLRPKDLESFLNFKAKRTHPEIESWSPETRKRVIQHFLASVRDFGLAVGTANKTTVRPALCDSPTRFLLRVLQLAGLSPEAQIQHEAFKLLGIHPSGIVDALSQLNSNGAIRFRMQADVIELEP